MRFRPGFLRVSFILMGFLLQAPAFCKEGVSLDSEIEKELKKMEELKKEIAELKTTSFKKESLKKASSPGFSQSETPLYRKELNRLERIRKGTYKGKSPSEEVSPEELKQDTFYSEELKKMEELKKEIAELKKEEEELSRLKEELLKEEKVSKTSEASSSEVVQKDLLSLLTLRIEGLKKELLNKNTTLKEKLEYLGKNYAELKTQNQVLIEELKRLKKELKEKSSPVLAAPLEERISLVKEELLKKDEVLTQQLDSLRKGYLELQAQNEALIDKLNNFKKELDKKVSSSSEVLVSEITLRIEGLKKELLNKNTTLKEKLEYLGKNYAELKTQNQAFIEELLSLKKEVEGKTSETVRVAFAKKIETLKKEIQSKNQDFGEELANLSRSYTELKEKNQAFLENLEAIQKEVEEKTKLSYSLGLELKERIDELNRNFQEETQSFQEEIENMEKKYSKLRLDTQLLLKEIQNLREGLKEVREARTSASFLGAKISFLEKELKERVQSLKSQIDSLYANYSSLNIQNQDLLKELSLLQKKAEGTSSLDSLFSLRIEGLKKELLNKNTTLKEELEYLGKNYAELKTQNQAFIEELLSLKKEAEEGVFKFSGVLEDKISSLGEEIKNIYENFQKKLSSLGQHYQELKERNENLVKELSDIKKEIGKKLALSENLTTSLRESVEKLKKEVQDKNQALDKKLSLLNKNYGELKKENKNLIKELKKTKEEVNKEKSKLYFKLAVAYTRLKQYKEAISAYEETLKLDPENYQAHYYLGLLYKYVSDDVERALFHFRKSLALAPDSSYRDKIEYFIKMLE